MNRTQENLVLINEQKEKGSGQLDAQTCMHVHPFVLQFNFPFCISDLVLELRSECTK